MPALAELVASLSLAADLAAGQPYEHGLRVCVLASGLAERAGLTDEERRDVYYVSLLRSIGCTSDAHEQSLLFGDELVARAELNLAPHLKPGEMLGTLRRHIGAAQPPVRRARMFAGTLAAGTKLPQQVAAAHCEAAELLGGRIGVEPEAQRALRFLFERWDGKGFPRGVKRDAIPQAARFVQVAYGATLLAELRSPDEAVAAVRQKSRMLYDPEVAALCDAAAVEELAVPDPWAEALAREPGGPTRLDGEGVDRVCRAAAEFGDVKSPWLLGHSTGVAELAEAAAWRLKLAEAEVALVRRAALLHDIGRVGVPNSVWERPGPLGSADWEAVRLHPYYAERVLSRCDSLRPFAEVASAHHERLDGSGYHRGTKDVSQLARLLAAADAYRAMTEARPHREALEPEQAARELQADAHAGRLDGESVAAVLAAAGHRVAKPQPERPAGLSEREVEVLGLLARGLTNRQIAERLVIAPKTVGHHVAHIYAKTGLSNRASASVFAVGHGLVE